MMSAAVSSETWDSSSNPISEIDVLWITAGLGCDGDTIAMTAATQLCTRCCDRGGYYEQGQFGEEFGSPQCMRFRLLFRALVCTRKEVIGQIHVCDAKLRRMNLPKKLSDFLNMSSVLQAELRSAGSQSMPYGVLDLYRGEYVEFD